MLQKISVKLFENMAYNQLHIAGTNPCYITSRQNRNPCKPCEHKTDSILLKNKTYNNP